MYRKNQLAGLQELNITLKSISADLIDTSNEKLSAFILGTSRKNIPIDTRHMFDSTGSQKKGGAWSVFTDAHYAAKQYFGHLLHLWDGKYKSIRDAKVSISKKIIESTKIGWVGAEGYAQKYRALKKAGMLTRRQSRWFHRAAESMKKIDLQNMIRDFVAIQRAKLEGKKISGKRYKHTRLKK